MAGIRWFDWLGEPGGCTRRLYLYIGELAKISSSLWPLRLFSCLSAISLQFRLLFDYFIAALALIFIREFNRSFVHYSTISLQFCLLNSWILWNWSLLLFATIFGPGEISNMLFKWLGYSIGYSPFTEVGSNWISGLKAETWIAIKLFNEDYSKYEQELWRAI